MMEKYRIAPFFDGIQHFRFSGADAFVSGDRALMIEKTGHILLCDREASDLLLKREIPEGMLHILIQRNFVSLPRWRTEFAHGKMEAAPEFFMVDLTKQCCMRCTYCLRDVKNGENDGHISEKVLTDICAYITDYCNEWRPAHISVQPWGGEPMMDYSAIRKMKRLILPEHTRVHFTMETNGVLLTEEKAGELYEEQISLSISLDGTEETHDFQRRFPDGSGSFAKVLEGIRNAQRYYGSSFGNITTVTENTAGYVEEILDYYARGLGLRSVKFNFVHRSDFSDCAGLCLSEDKIASTQLRILAKLASLHEEGFPIVEENIATKFKNLLFGHSGDICLSRGCNGGRKMIVFGGDGRIYPCELTDYPEESIGSIYDGIPLRQMIADAVENRAFFMEKKISVCGECPWYVYCQGGCTIHCMSLGKKAPEIDTIECAVNRALYPEMIRMVLEKPDIVNHMLGGDIISWEESGA